MTAFRAKVVRQSPDLQRIRSLPRRELTSEYQAAAVARMNQVVCITKAFSLKGAQASLLAEVGPCGGGVGFLPVGAGKTAVCEAIPIVLGQSNAVLIAPAALEQKTYADRRELRKSIRVGNPPPRFISKESLALEQNAYLLDQIDPAVLIVDESDELSNPTKGAPKRIIRFVDKKRAKGKAAGLPWPHGCWVIPVTGTPSRKSILAYWHWLRLALGDQAPVPAARVDAEVWAQALDEGTPRSGFRPHPGALGETVELARQWYRDRLRQTPGVVIVDEDSAGTVPLSINIEIAPECAVIDRAFDKLRTAWQSSSGEDVSDPLSLFRIESDTGLGIERYWAPPPPKPWSAARRVFAKFVREKIASSSHSRTPLDTEGQVVKACGGVPAVADWLKVRADFDPLKSGRTRWISTTTLEWACEWLTAEDEPSVLWCGSVEFSDRVSRTLRLPYYGPKGKEVRTGRELHAADVNSSMVCSWHANRRGFNLQAWRRNGIILPPQSAKALEQTFGRPHRQGQTQPVFFTILATSGGTLDAFASAYAEAEFARDTAGHTQKILRATISPLPDPPANLRWVTRS
jgi:hypothetical protein